MRISKPPEERKQEIIDTAMIIFAEKGYEATTVSDIAKRMNVVSGLFYKYFSSKEELYHVALEHYAKQFSEPVIEALKKDYDNIQELEELTLQGLCIEKPKQQYHAFFHGEGNDLFHQQLNYMISNQIVPHVAELLNKLSKEYQLNLGDPLSTAQFLVFGVNPILDNEDLEPNEKCVIIKDLFEKLLK